MPFSNINLLPVRKIISLKKTQHILIPILWSKATQFKTEVQVPISEKDF